MEPREFNDHFAKSGWFYSDSDNEYPIIDGSRCFIACPNGSYIPVEHFYGEHDDVDSDCFQSCDNGIYVLLALWNTIGPDAQLPSDEDALEKLRVCGIKLLYKNNSDWNNMFLKYPLKLTSGTWRRYEDLPASNYSRWDEGVVDNPVKILSNIYYAMSDCYKRQLLGDTSFEKCESCYCRFLGIPGDCRNQIFKELLKKLHQEHESEYEDSDITQYSKFDERSIHNLELSPYWNPESLLEHDVHIYKKLFASPIPGIDAKKEKECDVAEYQSIECPSCHKMTPYGTFCSHCQTKLRDTSSLITATPIKCKYCGKEVFPGKFCTACGHELASK